MEAGFCWLTRFTNGINAGYNLKLIWRSYFIHDLFMFVKYNANTAKKTFSFPPLKQPRLSDWAVLLLNAIVSKEWRVREVLAKARDKNFNLTRYKPNIFKMASTKEEYCGKRRWNQGWLRITFGSNKGASTAKTASTCRMQSRHLSVI